MKKIVLGIVSICLIITSVYIFNIKGDSLDGVSANPDYICWKNVVGEPCRILNEATDCLAWQQNGTRVCNGVRTTQVQYKNRRVSCVAGYNRYKYRDSDGASGRHSSIYPRSTENCSIIQEDHISPTGQPKVQ